MNEIVIIENLTFGYNHNNVLENVNLSIYEGDFLALIGANGAAKSTLMKLMVGLLKPKSGSIKLLGQDIKEFNQWDKLGYVSQYASQVNTSFPATVEEIVLSGLYRGFGKPYDKKEKEHALKEALSQVKMEGLSKRLVGSLSGGQRQKVFVAKALINKPQVLFLDEPTTGIDPNSQQEFYNILTGLNNQGITIVIVSHDIGNVFYIAKRIGCVRNKSAYIHDTIDEVTEEHIAEVLGYRIVRKSV